MKKLSKIRNMQVDFTMYSDNPDINVRLEGGKFLSRQLFSALSSGFICLDLHGKLTKPVSNSVAAHIFEHFGQIATFPPGLKC